MNTKLVTLQLPTSLYDQLQTLATEGKTDFAGIITQLVHQTYQRRDWLHDLSALRQQIQTDGGVSLRESKEEVISQLRQTRHDIFETEYAHLYR